MATLFAMLATGACGNEPGQQSIVTASTGSLTFFAASPDVPAPAPQTFSVTIGSGTVYVAVNHHGRAIAASAYTLGNGTAQVDVTPALPANLGAGTFSGTVAITGYTCANSACSALIAGNTVAVSVTYGIPPVVRQVAPYIGTTNIAGRAIVRGQGFKTVDVQGVSFGATSATSFSVVSDTQIQADYPALLSGTHAVTLQSANSPGAITSSANLVVIAAPGYGAASWGYPSASPNIKSLTFDAERAALWIGTDIGGGTVLRYPYSAGVWGAPASLAIAGLSHAALSVAGDSLLALSSGQLALINAQSLVIGSGVSGPTLPTGAFLKNVVVTNDGKAVVTTGITTSANTSLYVFDPITSTFSAPATTPSLSNATPGVSVDGSLVSLVQGDVTFDPAPAIYQYFASIGTFTASAVTLIQSGVAPVLNRAGTRIVLNGHRVYDGAYALLGTLPTTTSAVVIVDRSSSPTALYDSSIAYALDGASQLLRVFDVTTTADGAAFAESGTGVALPANPGAGVRMVVSPDGGNLFIAGSDAAMVMPTPP